MTTEIVGMSKFSAKKWNSCLVESGVKGTIYQTTHWAEHLGRLYNDKPVYITSFDKKGNIEGLVVCMESCYAKHATSSALGRYPPVFNSMYRNILSPLMHTVFPHLYWQNGPITLSGDNSSQDALSRLVAKVLKMANERGCYAIRARPAYSGDSCGIFTSMGFSRKEMGTFLVSLDAPRDVVWKRIKKSARKNIKKCNALEVHEVSRRSGIAQFHTIYVQTCRRSRTAILPLSHFVCLWDNLQEHDAVSFFIARLDDLPVGGLVVLRYNNMIHEYAVADSDLARSRRLYVGDFLKWHVLEWGRERGYRFYDLAGVELHKILKGHKKAEAIYKFKSKWGGTLLKFHDYNRFLIPQQRWKRGIMGKLNLALY